VIERMDTPHFFKKFDLCVRFERVAG